MRTPATGRSGRRRWCDGATVGFLLVGLVPIVGLVTLGTWPRWEVGAGTAIVLLAAYDLIRGP